MCLTEAALAEIVGRGGGVVAISIRALLAAVSSDAPGAVDGISNTDPIILSSDF